MVVISLVVVAIAVPLEGLIWTRDWWHPVTVTGTTVGVEDVIYSIGNGGYMAALYAAFFGSGPIADQRKPSWLLRLAPLAALALVPVVLFFGVGMHSFTATTVGAVIGLSIMLIARHDLVRVAVISSIVGTAIAIPVYLATEAIFPGWISATWELPRLSGLLLLGIPLEDLLWYLYTAAFWSIYYKYAVGLRLTARAAVRQTRPLPIG
jgi:hypothetical protein